VGKHGAEAGGFRLAHEPCLEHFARGLLVDRGSLERRADGLAAQADQPL
jgi:hypothetical protein